MSLRDHFAASALIGYRGHPANEKPEYCADWAYKVADAMLKARSLDVRRG